MKSAIAPFTPEQIASITAYQNDNHNTPLHCYTKGHRPLVAQSDGLHCPDCNYLQMSIDEAITNGSWRKSLDYLWRCFVKRGR